MWPEANGKAYANKSMRVLRPVLNFASARSIHQAGGTVMGASADDSVTNSHGQTHEVENLFIVGASLFPTIAAVNPTATLSALALRTPDFIVAERAGLTGQRSWIVTRPAPLDIAG